MLFLINKNITFVILLNIFTLKSIDSDPRYYDPIIAFFDVKHQNYYSAGYGVIISSRLIITGFVLDAVEIAIITKGVGAVRSVVCPATEGFSACAKEDAIGIAKVLHQEKWSRILHLYKQEAGDPPSFDKFPLVNIEKLSFNQLSIIMLEKPFHLIKKKVQIVYYMSYSIPIHENGDCYVVYTTDTERYKLRNKRIRIVKNNYCVKIRHYSADYCMEDPEVPIRGREPIICSSEISGIVVKYNSFPTFDGVLYLVQAIGSNSEWIQDIIGKDNNAGKLLRFEFLLYHCPFIQFCVYWIFENL